ncbi:E3 ubiquitin-protein ligase SINA-like 2 [Capsella rubella]|nr:E3 ubiquitin-protein ligase SINA-like 2 [Capsella rubella]
MAGEASSSRLKRQRVPSISQSVCPEDGGGGDVAVGTLFELDLLECPSCCHSLTSPIFQCDNGHIACSSCCAKTRNECLSCKLPIGKYRSRIMERVVEAVIVPLPSVAKNAFAGEASSSRLNRQRVPSVVGEECENGEGDVVVRSGKLFELNLLNCPVCSDALTGLIFQCDNEHIACSSCCTKLRHICPSCTLPIGIYRCRIMEEVVKAVIVPCPNAKHGCTETFSYGKELIHEKKCSFALCYCPASNCNYSGVYKDLYSHYAANHKNIYKRFSYGYSHHACLGIDCNIVVFQEYGDGPLVVVQCFKEPQGVFLTANCIAPSAPGVGNLSYDLSYSTAGKTVTFKSSEMNRIQKVSFQTPEKDFMIIPDYLLSRVGLLKSIRICIRNLGKEKEKTEDEEEEEEDEDEDEDEDEEEEDEDEEEELEEEEEEEVEEDEDYGIIIT